MTEYAYLPADLIKPGDILPDISRHPVTSIAVFPHESVRVVGGYGEYVRHFPYFGPDFGWDMVRIKRPASPNVA